LSSIPSSEDEACARLMPLQRSSLFVNVSQLMTTACIRMMDKMVVVSKSLKEHSLGPEARGKEVTLNIR